MNTPARSSLLLLPLLCLALAAPVAHADDPRRGESLEAVVELTRPGAKAPLLSWRFLVSDQGRSSTVSDGDSRVEVQVRRQGKERRLYATVEAQLDLGKVGRIRVNSLSGMSLGERTTILRRDGGTAGGAELTLTLSAPKAKP